MRARNSDFMNFQKLKNASLQELRVRTSQRISALNERLGWSDLVKLPRDSDFALSLNLPEEIVTHGLLDHFRSRTQPSFFRGFEDTRATCVALQNRSPEAVRSIIQQADRICDGKFDLLGITGLSFGNPIDWHREPKSGKRIPLLHWSKLDFLDSEVAGDKKITWELNRHQYFMTLGQAYQLTSDERYARVFGEHLDEWMDANQPKLGINWASSLEVAFRAMAWLWAFNFFKSSRTLSGGTFKRAWKFLYLSARHLESYLSTYFSPNTHLTGEALGLFFLGTLLPEFKDAKRWQRIGRQILIEQLPIHVRPDGVYFEQSSYYHRYTTDFYLHFLLLARANNVEIPTVVEETLQRLLDHMMYITRPDGTTPLFGDDDGGQLSKLGLRAANDFRATLGVGATTFDRPDYKFVSGEVADELLWLTGVEGLTRFDSIIPSQPAKTSVAFLSGGYFVMRDGWSSDSNFLLFDCGPHGSLAFGHAHADALSIDVAVNGHTALVDPATYTYTGSREARDWFRGSEAHNTLTIDDESSSVPNGPFSWKAVARCSLESWITEDRFDFVSGRHDGFKRLSDPATVKREILFVKGSYWVIRDTVVCAGPHKIDLSFHYDSGPDVESNVSIHCFGNGRQFEEKGFVSHCYGQRETGKVITFSANFAGSDSVITFLLPKEPASEWSVREVSSEHGRAFEVHAGNSVDLVIIPAAAPWAWTRSISGIERESFRTAVSTATSND
jgi:hypothetical protein